MIFQDAAPELSNPEIRKEILTLSPMVLYMLQSNPLALKDKIEIEDLRAQNIEAYSTDAALSHAEFPRRFFDKDDRYPCAAGQLYGASE